MGGEGAIAAPPPRKEKKGKKKKKRLKKKGEKRRERRKGGKMGTMNFIFVFLLFSRPGYNLIKEWGRNESWEDSVSTLLSV